MLVIGDWAVNLLHCSTGECSVRLILIHKENIVEAKSEAEMACSEPDSAFDGTRLIEERFETHM